MLKFIRYKYLSKTPLVYLLFVFYRAKFVKALRGRELTN